MSSPEKLPESPAVPKAPEAIVTPEDVPTIETYSVSTPWKDPQTGQLDLLRMARGARGLLAME